MLGLLATLLFSIGAAGVGSFLLRRLTASVDPALALGVHGLAGLAALGMLTLPVALLPGGTHWGVYGVGAVALSGYWPLFQSRPRLKPPAGFHGLILLGAVVVFLCSAVGVLSPSDRLDWDTLAYHLAVPKMWIHDGQMHYVSFIHQSNFPLTIDGLYIWGLDWGGQAGAKAFSLCFAIYGAIALFGFARQRYGEVGGWWALLAYVGVPMVAWESGTAYVDIGNGLFVALGILFAAQFALDPADRRPMWLCGIFLGFAAGSKYTGLQTIGAVVLVLALVWAVRRRVAPVPGLKSIGLLALVACAICSPWYLRNVINTGNPVFPFFYSILGGRNWDTFSDQIYRNQQQEFGAGRPAPAPNANYASGPLEPTRLGASILGLAYQSGRYADPRPIFGDGLAFVCLGAVPIGALLAWLLSGRLSRFEYVISGVVLLSLLMWFGLSQQSRYIVGLAFPLCVLAGGLVGGFSGGLSRIGYLVAGATVVQLLTGLFVLTRYADAFTEKLRVALGVETPEEYQQHHLSFYDPAQDLNRLAQGGRVALYDEVFGYFLDVPYFWANPGHSTEMGYEQMQTPDQLIDSLHRLGITYVYINLGQMYEGMPNLSDRWRSAAGLDAPPMPYSQAEQAQMIKNPQDKYKLLLAEAVASHLLTTVPEDDTRKTRLIFSVGP